MLSGAYHSCSSYASTCYRQSEDCARAGPTAQGPYTAGANMARRKIFRRTLLPLPLPPSHLFSSPPPLVAEYPSGSFPESGFTERKKSSQVEEGLMGCQHAQEGPFFFHSVCQCFSLCQVCLISVPIKAFWLP